MTDSIYLYDIFISYPKENEIKALITNIKFELESRYDIKYWIDYENKINENDEDYEVYVKNAISNSKMMLCLINESYFKSTRNIAEIEYCINLEKKIYFIVLDGQFYDTFKNKIQNIKDKCFIVKAFKDIELFQNCKGEYYETFINTLMNYIEDFDEKLISKINKEKGKSEKLTEFEKKNWFAISFEFHYMDKFSPHNIGFYINKNNVYDLIDVNHEDKWGLTPIFIASNQGNRDVVNFLINKKANLNKTTFNGLTPLHITCFKTYKFYENKFNFNLNDKIDIFESLLKNDAKITYCDKGWYPHHYACFYGIKPLINYFCQKNLIGQESKLKETSLHVACSNKKNFEIIKMLIPLFKIDDKDIYGRTCFHIACKVGNLNIVKELYKNKANINIQNGNGETALHYACWNGHLDIVKFLCKHKIRINVPNEEGQTALHFAARMNHYEIVGELCYNGANVEFNDKQRRTPIYIASQHARYAIEELMKSYEKR